MASGAGRVSRAPSWRRNPVRVPMVIEATSGSGGPCSLEEDLGGTVLTFYCSHVHTLAMVGEMDLGLQTLCLRMLLPALLHRDVG